MRACSPCAARCTAVNGVEMRGQGQECCHRRKGQPSSERTSGKVIGRRTHGVGSASCSPISAKYASQGGLVCIRGQLAASTRVELKRFPQTAAGWPSVPAREPVSDARSLRLSPIFSALLTFFEDCSTAGVLVSRQPCTCREPVRQAAHGQRSSVVTSLFFILLSTTDRFACAVGLVALHEGERAVSACTSGD